MLRLLLTRALLMALPFVLYAIWREWTRRTGREAGAAPWGWLAGAGAVLVGLSLMITVAFRPDTRGKGYVPAEAHPGGKVTPAQFDARKHPPAASPDAPNTSP